MAEVALMAPKKYGVLLKKVKIFCGSFKSRNSNWKSKAVGKFCLASYKLSIESGEDIKAYGYWSKTDFQLSISILLNKTLYLKQNNRIKTN